METTEAAVTVLDTLMEGYYTPIDLNLAVEIVAHNFFILVAVLLSTYPFLFILHKLIRFCEKAFDSEAIRKMEAGGIWNRLPDGSIYTGLEKIATIRVFDRLVRRK